MDTDTEKAVALLHDVIEDSDFLYEDIEMITNTEIAECVEVLTHNKEDHESYFDYINRVRNFNDIVIKVKIADLRHNSDLSRIQYPTDKDYKRIEKYKKAIEILESKLN